MLSLNLDPKFSTECFHQIELSDGTIDNPICVVTGPADEDNEWCHREVYVAKSSGKPRRCIDYKPGLNRWVKRDAYATESPFHVVKRIPGNTWKTVTDAWNGYHLIPLHPDSKKLTTFILMEGKFRYTR